MFAQTKAAVDRRHAGLASATIFPLLGWDTRAVALRDICPIMLLPTHLAFLVSFLPSSDLCVLVNDCDNSECGDAECVDTVEHDGHWTCAGSPIAVSLKGLTAVTENCHSFRTKSNWRM